MAEWFMGLDNGRLTEAQSIADGISLDAANDERAEAKTRQPYEAYSWNGNTKPSMLGFDVDIQRGIVRVYLPAFHARKALNRDKVYRAMVTYFNQFCGVYKLIVYTESNTRLGSILVSPDGALALTLCGHQIEQKAATAHPCESIKGKAYPRELGPSDGPVLAEL